jgi:flagellin-like protein
VKPLSKKIMACKKGISPILATLLLIVIAVAAIVVTYAWVMTYMSSTTTQAGARIYKANVNFYNQSTTKKIDFDIGNSGTSDTKIIQLYAGTSTATLQNQTITATSLPAGAIRTITINYDWTNTVTYYFKVISSGGQTLEWSEQAPTNP